MTGGAVIGKMRERFLQDFGSKRDRVRRVPFLDWNRQMTDLPCHHHFQYVRFGLGAEPGRKQLIADPTECRKAGQHDEDDEPDELLLHNRPTTIQSPRGYCHRPEGWERTMSRSSSNAVGSRNMRTPLIPSSPSPIQKVTARLKASTP